MTTSTRFDRRTFLVGAAAAAAWSITPVALAGSERPGLVVAVEQQHSLHFAQTMIDAGARGLVARGDTVRFWRDDVAPLLAGGRQRISGLSDWGTYLILSGCAAEMGLRVRHEARHDVATDTRARPASLLADRGQGDWSAELARQLLRSPAQLHVPQRAPVPGRTTLISWVLA